MNQRRNSLSLSTIITDSQAPPITKQYLIFTWRFLIQPLNNLSFSLSTTFSSGKPICCKPRNNRVMEDDAA